MGGGGGELLYKKDGGACHTYINVKRSTVGAFALLFRVLRLNNMTMDI